MLSKSRKLRGRDVFGNISQKARRFPGKYFNLAIIPISGPSKFACVVSLKVSKKATVRNKLRRRCFSIITGFLGKNEEGCGVVFYGRPGAEAASFDELKQDLESILGRVGILNKLK